MKRKVTRRRTSKSAAKKARGLSLQVDLPPEITRKHVDDLKAAVQGSGSRRARLADLFRVDVIVSVGIRPDCPLRINEWEPPPPAPGEPRPGPRDE